MATQSPASVQVPIIKIPTINTLDPVSVIIWALSWLLYAAGAVAIGFLIYAGIMFITASGDPEKVTKARNMILYSIIGIVVIAASYGLVMWASSLVNTVK